MKNKIKYFVLYPLMVLIVIATLTYDVKELIGLGQRIPFGSSYWKDSLNDAISTNKSIKLGTGDSLYYNGVVVTSGTGGGGIAASDNITFTGRDSTTELWRFGDSVRFYDHVLFKDTLKVSGAIAVMDSLKVAKNLWFNNTTKLSTTLGTFYSMENAFLWQNQNAYSLLDLDSSNGMNLHYGVYTGNGSQLTNVDAITLKGQDTTHFARTDTLITEDIKGKWNFWDIVSFITIPTIPSFFQNVARTKQYFLPNSASDTLLTRSQTQAIQNKTIDSTNTITKLQRGTMMLSHVAFNPVNSTTYYIGAIPSSTPSGNEGLRRIYIPSAVTIESITMFVYVTGGSTGGQLATFNLLIDNGTPITIGTSALSSTGAWSLITGTNLNGVITGGGTHWFDIQLVCPAWTTAPTNLHCHATIQFKY